MKLAAAFVVLFTFIIQAQAQTLTQTEAKTPFIVPSCKTVGMDTMGTLGLNTSSLTSSDDGTEVTLSVTSSLSVCRLNVDAQGDRSMAWEIVNPYAGFEVQYYDDATSSLQLRKVYIDTAKTYNRIELVAFANGPSATNPVIKSAMTADAGNSFSGSITLKKSDLLTTSDLKKLEAGETVKKTVELHHVSNFTTFIGGVDVQLGDESRSARNVILSFKK